MTAVLCAVVAQVFPLHAEIDFGPLALRFGTAYKGRIVVEAASGIKVDIPFALGATANSMDAATAILGGFEQAPKWGALQQGVVVIVSGRAGSPVKKVTIEGPEPKPTWRWVPRQK